MKSFDIIVFGGTGFTGEHVVRELFLTAASEEISWAIAGRSLQKMRQTLQSISDALAINDFTEIGMVIADIHDTESIKSMCERAKLVINCVGPYFLLGRPVIEGCLAAKCHYLDISGEPLFMEQMEADYHQKAEDLGIVIVSACGFDSIPADIGVRFAQIHFPGILTSIESYLKVGIGRKGFSVHLPTFQCIINGFSSRDSLLKLRKDLNMPKIQKFGSPLRLKTGIWRENGSFCVPFAGSDRSVICRTQRAIYNKDNVIPAQTGVYLMVQSTLQFIYLCLFGIIFLSLVHSKFGRKLLMSHPKVFTLGLVSKDGATPEQISQSSFSFIHKGCGYSTGHSLEGEPDKFIEIEVSGPDPGYVSCARFISQAAYSVLNHGPQHYGVLTPGAALDVEDYVDRLNERGISFNITKIGSINSTSNE